MDFEIKLLQINDLSLLKQLLLLWLEEEEAPQPLPTDEYLSQLLFKTSFCAIVAIDQNLVVGGLTAFEIPLYFEEGNEMFLYEIGVQANYRKKGVGKLLIQKLQEICTNKGIKTMYVGTEFDNLPAHKLYHRTGGKLEEIAWFTYEN